MFWVRTGNASKVWCGMYAGADGRACGSIAKVRRYRLGGPPPEDLWMTGDKIRALRHVREIADDMHWRGMHVPALYQCMAEEFRDLVQSGAYAEWVAKWSSN